MRVEGLHDLSGLSQAESVLLSCGKAGSMFTLEPGAAHMSRHYGSCRI